MIKENEVFDFIDQQKEKCPTYAANIKQLEAVETKAFNFGSYSIIAQHNPARILSTSAKVDNKSISNRKCFLCAENRPVEQLMFDIAGHYSLLVNPFPILNNHLTIANKNHCKQSIFNNIEDMLLIAESLPSFIVFYNGPKCGASAPDHMHFQAVAKGQMPFEKEFSLKNCITLSDNRDGCIGMVSDLGRKCLILHSSRIDMMVSFFRQMYNQLPHENGDEPLMNIFARFENGSFDLYIFCRKAHRPTQYFSTEDPWMVSPGAIDMGGVLVLPREEDFRRINKEIIEDIYKQVSL